MTPRQVNRSFEICIAEKIGDHTRLLKGNCHEPVLNTFHSTTSSI